MKVKVFTQLQLSVPCTYIYYQGRPEGNTCHEHQQQRRCTFAQPPYITVQNVKTPLSPKEIKEKKNRIIEGRTSETRICSHLFSSLLTWSCIY
jgi:hypothetical protein